MMKNLKPIFLGFFCGVLLTTVVNHTFEATPTTVEQVTTPELPTTKLTLQTHHVPLEAADMAIDSLTTKTKPVDCHLVETVKAVDKLTSQVWYENLSYLAEYAQDDVSDVKTDQQAVEYLMDYFSTSDNRIQQRLDALQSATQIQPEIFNADVTQSVLAVLTELDESDHDGEMTQALYMLQNNIDADSLGQVEKFLLAHDRDFRVAALRLIGSRDSYQQYSQSITQVLNNDIDDDVRKVASMVLKQYYGQ